MKNKLIEAAIFIKNWCATRGVYDEKAKVIEELKSDLYNAFGIDE